MSGVDSFNFLVSVILIFLALQYQQAWIVFAILILSVFTIKSMKAIVGLVAASLILYLLLDYGSIASYFPFVVLGIFVMGLILGIGKAAGESQTYAGGGYSDLLGGFGGGGTGGYGGP